MKKVLTHLSYIVTTGCNLNCKHCYLRNFRKRPIFLRYDVFLHTLRSSISLYESIKAVSFTGGEPLLHPHLENFIRDAIKFDLRVNIYTNALLYPKIIKLKKKYPEIQYYITPHKIDVLHKIKDISPSILLYPDFPTLAHFKRVIKLLKKITYKSIIILYPLAFPDIPYVKKIPFEEWKGFVEFVKSLIHEIGLDNVFIENYPFKKTSFHCEYWRDILFGPDGKQYICCISFGRYGGKYELNLPKIKKVEECPVLKHVWGEDYRKRTFPFITCPLSVAPLSKPGKKFFPGELS